jgi:EAL domain-containing protein (putative c-di-GMP-specific phosphodiesterase class I)/CheY-like chemotaxis protein
MASGKRYPKPINGYRKKAMSVDKEVILIVDDDPLEREIVADDLKSLGFNNILYAASGAEALSLIKSGTVTTLLTDIMMPGMDGPQFLRQLAEVGCKARVVLISGVSNDIMNSIGTLGRSHGLNLLGYIHKPTTPVALKAMLQREVTAPKATGTKQVAPQLDLSAGRLRDALNQAEIHPWYQPKVDIEHLRLTGVEALARWRFPDGKLISPAEFIPAIEALGLADELFFCILEQVLKDLRRWRAAGRYFKVSVNLSMDCAFKLDLPERIDVLLEKYDIPPDQLVVEVTESRVMSDSARAMETLTRLSLMGAALSIDDFGTGYSNLVQVANLPFGELKLDGSFVQKIDTDSKADAILRGTIVLGRSLGMDIVAEGVESFGQLDWLRNNGADVAQGYLLARPMAVGPFDTWLQNWRPGLATQPGCARQFNVLVVDDERSMRSLVDTQLRQHLPEARIFLASSGEEALKIAAEELIDATTLDFHMPGIDGLELLRQLRNCCPSARHVFLTANLTEQIAKEATRLGALYCPKPLMEPQIDRIVRYFGYPASHRQ